MMFTRCPACQTVFRLHPEQLKQRNGEVRCGHCFHPFNALTFLIDGDPLPPATPSVPLTSPAFNPSAPPPLRMARKPAETPAASISQPQPTPTQATKPDTTSFALEIDALDFDIPQIDAPEYKPATSPGVRFPVLLDTDREPFIPSSAATAPPVTLAADIPSPATPTETPAPPEHPRTPVSPVSETKALTLEDVDPETALPSAEIERLDEVYGSTAPIPAWKRMLSGLMIGLLAGALSIQGIYLFRNEIARTLPGLRPILTHACEQFGCILPLPRQAGLLSIDNSDLQSDPGKPGRYILYATVKNQAEYLQDWPHLELTLTDARDAPLSRKAFAPDSWVSPEKLRAGFPARSDVSVRLVFDASEITPSSYRLYVFYP